ncbi:CBO0543 family protein [Metabacillus fastidiosus]|uniref:CBO0543 family protein n=1 Tax=Metabacillus fastidiosus TaxID=1458 RepID=UPI003D282E5F
MTTRMTFQEGLNQVDKATQKIVEGNQIVTDTIMNTFLFTWQWWISLAMLIVPWIIWGIFRKRESSNRLLYTGLIIMVLSAILDTFGVENGNWSYPVKVIPSVTISYSFRFSVLPVLAMFFLQFKPDFNPFVKAIIFGGLSAYIGMPILAAIDLYKKVDWAYTYSFFILTFMYLIAHWSSRRNNFEKI